MTVDTKRGPRRTNRLESIKGLTVVQTEELVLWLDTRRWKDNPGYNAITGKCSEEIRCYANPKRRGRYPADNIFDYYTRID
jgi:hypothetical protein